MFYFSFIKVTPIFYLQEDEKQQRLREQAKKLIAEVRQSEKIPEHPIVRQLSSGAATKPTGRARKIDY